MEDTAIRSIFRRQPKRFLAFDSEFLMSGKIKAPEDVHTIQFSDGTQENTEVVEGPEELKDWLNRHRRTKVLYGFVALPDLGSVQEWLPDDSVKVWKRGEQTQGIIKYGSTKIHVYDTQPLLHSFGLHRLEDVGEVVGVSKLDKPDWLGLRGPQSESEREYFLEYAKVDAVITAKACEWLWENFGADASIHVSAGTLAKDIFRLPSRLAPKEGKKKIQLSSLEQTVRNNTYAGRNEAFHIGYVPNVFYNDVKSLYPCSLITTRAIEIVSVEECSPSEVVVSDDLNNKDFGWLEGSFYTENDIWGLPLRGQNNFYASGKIQGFYHSFDLASAKAEVLHVTHAYKPIVEKLQIHDKARDLLLKRLHAELSDLENKFVKAIENSLIGKTGEYEHIAPTSNFFCYSTVMAYSHLIMSRLFEKCSSPILGTDTDSIFSQMDVSGKQFELSDGEVSIPLIVDVKGKGDLALFRSKVYILKTQDKPVYGRHAWFYPKEDFLKLFDGITELYTRMDIKHTLLTKTKEARKLALGRWFTKPVLLDLPKLKSLLKADVKRNRSRHDSYQLVIEHKNVESEAWRYEEIMSDKANVLDYPFFKAELEAEEFRN